MRCGRAASRVLPPTPTPRPVLVGFHLATPCHRWKVWRPLWAGARRHTPGGRDAPVMCAVHSSCIPSPGHNGATLVGGHSPEGWDRSPPRAATTSCHACDEPWRRARPGFTNRVEPGAQENLPAEMQRRPANPISARISAAAAANRLGRRLCAFHARRWLRQRRSHTPPPPSDKVASLRKVVKRES